MAIIGVGPTKGDLNNLPDSYKEFSTNAKGYRRERDRFQETITSLDNNSQSAKSLGEDLDKISKLMEKRAELESQARMLAVRASRPFGRFLSLFSRKSRDNANALDQINSQIDELNQKGIEKCSRDDKDIRSPYAEAFYAVFDYIERNSLRQKGSMGSYKHDNNEMKITLEDLADPLMRYYGKGSDFVKCVKDDATNRRDKVVKKMDEALVDCELSLSFSDLSPDEIKSLMDQLRGVEPNAAIGEAHEGNNNDKAYPKDNDPSKHPVGPGMKVVMVRDASEGKGNGPGDGKGPGDGVKLTYEI